MRVTKTKKAKFIMSVIYWYIEIGQIKSIRFRFRAGLTDRKCPSRILFAILTLLCLSECQKQENFYNSWRVYKGDKTSSSYSALNQINKNNVNELEVVWTYRTGDLKEDHPRTGIETNPIIVDGMLYGASPHLKAFAINAKTGKELWKFDPFKDERSRGKLRSVTYWEEGKDKRIFFTAGSWLYALDAETGKLISEFGQQGKVSLNKGLRKDPDSISVTSPSPGIIYQNLIILGSSVSPDYKSPPGYIRAYNVKTGELAWVFHTIPLSGERGSKTWQIDAELLKQQGGVNNWAGMSLDEERGIVYVPVASPNYDYYGGNRPGENLYSNSLVALDAATGKYNWHFQMIHHGLWDYDPPAPPNLVTVKKHGEKIDAVAQITKHGFTFLFNRVTGEPIFPIKEKSVPQSRVKNEQSWPTQPFPTKPEPFVRQNYTREDLPDRSAEVRDSVLLELKKYRNEGLFTPPDPKGSIQLPGTRGAAKWGGAAYDPKSGVLYVNSSTEPEIATVRKVGGEVNSTASVVERGRSFYVQHCASCHGIKLEGSPPTYPPLRNINQRITKQKVKNIIEKGGSMMPAFNELPEKKKDAIITYLFNQKSITEKEQQINNLESDSSKGQYQNITNHKLLKGPQGYPGIKPPWGALNAIDLSSGKIKWKEPLGSYHELTKQGVPPTGMPNMGGPIVTAGGVIFIAATVDQKFRAFDKENGELLWETILPAAGFATPATYMSGGRQYVVIAAGGGRGTPGGDYYVAFALLDSLINK